MDTLTLKVAARFEKIARYKKKKQVRSEDGGKTTVYVYSERQVQHRNREKAKRLEKLSKSIRDLRAKVKRDLRSDDPEKKLTALAVSLIDATYERVGNEESASGKSTQDGEKHFGVTGWKRKHVSFRSNAVFIKYVGKSGVKQEKKVTDSSIRKALRDAYEAQEDKDAGILEWDEGKITPEKVNAYLEPFNITAKDIRGFHANQEMRQRLKEVRGQGGKLSEDKKERAKQLKEEFKKALEVTAEVVGHEPSTLRSQYLVPGLESNYTKDGTVIDKFASTSEITEEMIDWFEERTKMHIDLVKKYCRKIEAYDSVRFVGLSEQAKEHDQSKYEEPEREPYIYITWQYYCKEHGKKFDEPKDLETLMSKATEHHVKSNPHHPEYHSLEDVDFNNRGDRDKPPKKAINATEMPNMDIAEMAADWMAMSEEKGTEPKDWADKNVNVRWNFTPKQVDLIYELLELFPSYATD